MQQTQILPHIRAILFSLFSLRNPDHVKKTNFATFLICSKHKFCHIFEPLWFDLSRTRFLWFTYFFHSDHWWVINSWLIFFTRFSWIVVLTRENRENKMARICGKICVCCIGHHMNKSSFKYFFGKIYTYELLELVAAESFSSGALSLVLGDETTSEIPVADSVWLLLAFISTTKVNLFRKMYKLPIVIIAIKLNKIDEQNITF